MRVVLGLMVVLVAGCMDPGASTLAAPEPNARMDAAMVPGERPVLASATIHEDPDEGVMDIEVVEGATTWAPRDVELTYHGVHEVWDEWGRRIPSHVFRYEPMRLYITDVTIGPAGLQLAGEWRPALVEYAFDLSDLRFLGQVNLDQEARVFREPEHRDAIVLDYILSLMLFMQFEQLDAPDERFHAYGYEAWFEKTDERHGHGACQPYRLRVEDDGDGRLVVCIPDGQHAPVWAYAGSGSEGITFTRTGGGFTLMDRQGAPMPLRVFATHPWQQVGADALAGPLVGPLAVPPSVHPDDWAARLHARGEALFGSASYVQYAAAHGDLYMHQAVTGWPGYGTVPLLEQLIGDDPLTPDEHAWLMVTPTDGSWMGIVDTWRDGIGGSEGNEQHVARQDGFTFDSTYPSLDQMGPGIAIGEVVAMYASFAPATPPKVDFLVWPLFDGFDLGAAQVMWWGLGACFQEADDEPYVAVSGLTGQLLGAGYVQSHANGCSAGGFLLDLPGGVGMAGRVDGTPYLLHRDLRDPLSWRLA